MSEYWRAVCPPSRTPTPGPVAPTTASVTTDASEPDVETEMAPLDDVSLGPSPMLALGDGYDLDIIILDPGVPETLSDPNFGFESSTSSEFDPWFLEYP